MASDLNTVLEDPKAPRIPLYPTVEGVPSAVVLESVPFEFNCTLSLLVNLKIDNFAIKIVKVISLISGSLNIHDWIAVHVSHSCAFPRPERKKGSSLSYVK